MKVLLCRAEMDIAFWRIPSRHELVLYFPSRVHFAVETHAGGSHASKSEIPLSETKEALNHNSTSTNHSSNASDQIKFDLRPHVYDVTHDAQMRQFGARRLGTLLLRPASPFAVESACTPMEPHNLVGVTTNQILQRSNDLKNHLHR